MRLITSAFLLAGVLASPEVIYRNGELALQDPTGKGQTLFTSMVLTQCIF